MHRCESWRSGRKPTRYDFDYASTSSFGVDFIDVRAQQIARADDARCPDQNFMLPSQVLVTDQQYLDHCSAWGGCEIRVAVFAYSAAE
jgi:hypothetical protein